MTFRRNFQRTVDTGPPRTNTGLTGLGAVGGPRGVGAGALRVLVEFISTYDSKALETLEKQLAGLDKDQSKVLQSQQAAVRQRAAAQSVITRIGNLEQTLTKGQNKLLKEAIDLEKQRQQQLSVAARAQPGSPEQTDALKKAAELRNQARLSEEALAKATGLQKRDVTLLVNAERNIANAKQTQIATTAKLKSTDQALEAIAGQRLATERSISVERGRAGAAVSKLGSLALGAVGGLVGGALVGIGFTAVQAALDAIGQGIRDIVDPANHAREAVKDFSSEIDGLADSKGVTFLEATRQKLADLGPIADGLNPKILAQAAAIEQVNEQLDTYNKLLDLQNNADKLREEAIQKRVDQLTKESTVLKNFAVNSIRTSGATAFIGAPDQAATIAAEKQRILAEATREVDSAANSAANSAAAAAAAEDRLAAAGSFAALQQGILADALNNVANQQIAGIDQQIANLPTTSPRTEGIQAQIDAINEATQASQVQSQLADIDTQRANILLEQRLSLLNKTVNVEKYSGEQRLTAIQHNIEALQNATFAEESQIDAIDGEIKATQRYNEMIDRRDKAQLKALDDQIKALRKLDDEQDKADQKILDGYDEKIKALQSQADALDLINHLLDIQYQANQVLHRNEGESIGDFLQRRAQENRKNLLDFAKLQIQQQIATVQGEKDTASAAIKAENDRREAIIERMQANRDALADAQEVAREERQLHLQALQDEKDRLQAVLDRHQKANQAAIKALQAEADRTQREIQLRELAERRKQILADETRRKRLQNLDKELKASQDADKAATESRRKQLEAQKDAIRKAYDDMIRLLDQRNRDELARMVKFANTSGELALLGGQIEGVKTVIGQLEGILASGVTGPLRDAIKAQLADLNKIIVGYNSQIRSRYHSVVEGAAKGGVFDLTNGSTLFGQNIRTGEAGPELGIVLSNKVVQALREREGRDAQFGDINLYGSRNPARDEYRLKRAVKEAIAETMR
jgi:hypothetical protein